MASLPMAKAQAELLCPPLTGHQVRIHILVTPVEGGDIPAVRFRSQEPLRRASSRLVLVEEEEYFLVLGKHFQALAQLRQGVEDKEAGGVAEVGAQFKEGEEVHEALQQANGVSPLIYEGDVLGRRRALEPAVAQLIATGPVGKADSLILSLPNGEAYLMTVRVSGLYRDAAVLQVSCQWTPCLQWLCLQHPDSSGRVGFSGRAFAVAEAFLGTNGMEGS